METYKPRRILIDPDWEARRLFADYKGHDLVVCLKINSKVKKKIEQNALNSAIIVDRYLNSIYAES